MILETCQANWVEGKDDNRWSICDSVGKVLILLPAGLDEMSVGAIRRFAIDHEKLAYEEGVQMGKDAMLAANHTVLKQLNDQNLLLKHQNEQLAANMERFLGEMGAD